MDTERQRLEEKCHAGDDRRETVVCQETVAGHSDRGVPTQDPLSKSTVQRPSKLATRYTHSHQRVENDQVVSR